MPENTMCSTFLITNFILGVKLLECKKSQVTPIWLAKCEAPPGWLSGECVRLTMFSTAIYLQSIKMVVVSSIPG